MRAGRPGGAPAGLPSAPFATPVRSSHLGQESATGRMGEPFTPAPSSACHQTRVPEAAFPTQPRPPPPEGQSWAVTARYTCPWKEAVREAGGSSARHRTRPAGRWGARSEQRRGKGVPRGETRGKGVPGERPPGKGSRGVGGGEALREGGPRGEEPRGRRGPGERSPLGSTEDPHFRQRGRPSLLPEARAALTGTFRHGNPVCPRLPHIPSQAAGPPPGRGRARGGPEPPRGLSGTAVCADPTGRETLPL